jgi:hypothetical protein
VIVDDLRRVEGGDWVERSARISWRGGSLRVHVRMPADVARPGADASPFLPMALLPAMLRGEDLVVEGIVSERLLDNAPRAAATYAAWRPGLRFPSVTADGTAEDECGRGSASFFSRGVDSMLSAARVRPEALDHLVFCDGLELLHDRAVSAIEVRRARDAAVAVGVPLVVVNSNVRALSHAVCDWGDAHGGALAGIGLALGVGRIIIPPGTSVVSIGPSGSNPVLDGLFSTAATTVQHDDMTLSRAGKIACLASQRPDLLPHLKVCYEENRPDNCGRCGKCIHTMASLEAASALALATQFPQSIDLARVRSMTVTPLQSALEWEATMRALPAGELRDAMGLALRGHRTLARRLRQVWRWRRGRIARPHPSWRDPGLGFGLIDHDRMLSLLHYGEPFPPLADEAEPPVQPLRLNGPAEG